MQTAHFLRLRFRSFGFLRTCNVHGLTCFGRRSAEISANDKKMETTGEENKRWWGMIRRTLLYNPHIRGKDHFQVQCCFTSTEITLRTIRDRGAQDGHLDFHTAPELCQIHYHCTCVCTRFRYSECSCKCSSVRFKMICMRSEKPI